MDGLDVDFMDGAELFAALFGSDSFLHLIGELKLATIVRVNADMELLQEAQRKRVEELTVNLKIIIMRYTCGDEEGFTMSMTEEAAALSKAPHGPSLLNAIGKAYQSQAQIELGNFFSSGIASMKRQNRVIKDHFRAIKLLDEGYDAKKVEKILAADLEAMNKTGMMLDKEVQRIIPASLSLYARLCYRMGHYRRGDKLLQTVCSLQLKTGGWFGSSHGKKQFDYYNEEEVCWTNLHFLEAVLEYDKAQRRETPKFNLGSDEVTILHRIKKILPELNDESKTLILCNKGWNMPLKKALKGKVMFWQDSLPMNIQPNEQNFDVVISVLSLTTSLRPKKAIKELFRLCKSEGLVIIIDKNLQKAKHFKLLPNEQ